MKNKSVVVCVKFFKGEINPFDAAALECALESGAKEITVLSMAPSSALNAVQGLTRLGVNAVLVSDSCYAGADTIATSFVLEQALLRLSPGNSPTLRCRECCPAALCPAQAAVFRNLRCSVPWPTPDILPILPSLHRYPWQGRGCIYVFACRCGNPQPHRPCK